MRFDLIKLTKNKDFSGKVNSYSSAVRVDTFSWKILDELWKNLSVLTNSILLFNRSQLKKLLQVFN